MIKLESIDMYQEVIGEEGTVLLFSADWCPDCRVIEPVLPDIEKRFSNFAFYYVDRDEFIDLCGDLNIFGIPSFVVFHKGEEIHRFVSKNRKTQEEIENFLEEAIAKL